MKVLYIHADHMEFEVKKPTPMAEEISEHEKKGRFEEVLVVFAAVEKNDEGKVEKVAAQAAGDILQTVEKVNAERVLVYPYAHLSSELSDPETGKELLKRLHNLLIERGIEAYRAPFGWYKAFRISCKGHPLSELSRHILAEEEKQVIKGEESFLVLTPDGSEYAPQDFEGGSLCFRAMLEKEALKKETQLVGEPKYLRLCRKFGIQWEALSDVGHMAFNPIGALMFDLVAEYSFQIVNDLGIPVYTIRGTNMFSLDEPAVREHAKLFGDRLYVIKGEKKDFVMRYAACHQQFAMMRNWNISYRNLPYGAFEVADSYRLEQSGETMLCFRTRRMNMPDLHVICRDLREAKEWFSKLDARIYEEAAKLGRDYEMLVNFSSKEAYEANKDLILELLNKHNKPALLHFYPEGINYYWTVNIEYHILDSMGRAREIGTVQIDVGNAKRFGIEYVDEEGKKRYPVILHTAIIGTIERYLYMLLDTAVLRENEGGIGCLPVWVTPEQVRILTVNERHVERARELARKMSNKEIRVGIDDRGETVNKKVREAKQDWVSYVIVIGDKELSSDTLTIYERATNKNIVMSTDDFIQKIKKEIEGKPFRPMYLPIEMSKRINF
ncbi:MAG: threonine--tRNA ligase [Methanomassiliicoccales archaeon]|jgi:threonyl-tRNA synthetase|nr:threonine--tRNA ligase [Methanomassiliicoccales archaeon]